CLTSTQLVENEEQFQKKLADVIVNAEKDVSVGVRLARRLPLPVENEETRPCIDLVVFIINLSFERSFQSVELSLKYVDPGFFLGKVCFLVTGARCWSVSSDRLQSVRKLATSLRCPLLYAEDQTVEGVNTAAARLLRVLKVTAGLTPWATGLSLSTLTRCTLSSDLEGDFD
uniref:Centromere protein M n=1 Tax=Denticeps clupeoides TaxID=299321 RepID=A0AAY4DQ54_9TELE